MKNLPRLARCSNKSGLLFLLLFLLIYFYSVANAQDEISIRDVEWQEKEHLLTYNLSSDARIKIRVGIYAGPLYRTLINIEKRPQGRNQEYWDGRDEEAKIDFLKYGKLHFCVDAPVKAYPDSILDVKFGEGIDLTKGPLQMPQQTEITIDVQEDSKPLFTKNGAELRVYVDSTLKKIDRLDHLPYTFQLSTEDISGGMHLVVMNLWEALNFSSAAYKSFEILLPEEKDSASDSQRRSLKGAVAFSQIARDGFWQIFTATLEGKNTRQLTTSPVDKRYPAWSADGREIAYVNNVGELWITDSNGTRNHKIPLPISCSEPRFSPDGRKIIFTSLEDVYHGSTKLWEVDLKTSELTKLVNRPWLQYNPAYAPDQAKIIFTDGPELFEQDIRQLDMKTGEITQITDNGPYDFDREAVFLNSGQEIVYSTNESGDYEIYKMDKFGRNKTNLSQSPQSCDRMPEVSRDDNKIFFLSDRTGKFALWQMNIDGSEAQPFISLDSDISSFSIYTDKSGS